MVSNDVTQANIVRVVESSTMPLTFQGDKLLFGSNMIAMTVYAIFGLMFAGWMFGAIYKHRHEDKLRHPVTLFRGILLFAGLACLCRNGGEALVLWSWDPNAALTSARVQNVKRYIDLLGLFFVGCWMLLGVLCYYAMCIQLRKTPFPIRMLARLPALKRPAVVVLATVIAGAVVAATH